MFDEINDDEYINDVEWDWDDELWPSRDDWEDDLDADWEEDEIDEDEVEQW